MEAVHVYPCQNILGEGPLWNLKEQAIYWVDIEGKKIQRYYPETKKYESFDVPQRVCLMAFREQGGLICGTEDGFYFWDTSSQTMEFITNPEKGKAGARFNDGKVDRKGRLWGGHDDYGRCYQRPVPHGCQPEGQQNGRRGDNFKRRRMEPG